MKLNESIAVSTSKALLVPYDRRHVPRYHVWMENPAIQEATASERLTLAEEFENQASWRASNDKLTFIICQPLSGTGELGSDVVAGKADEPGRMVGDVNFFLYPDDDDDDDDGDREDGRPARCIGEVDIMVAEERDRGKGVGKAVVAAFLHYIWRNLEGLLGEYGTAHADVRFRRAVPELGMLMAKIKEGNAKSIALFRSLGFEQEGEVNYFGEVKLVLRDFTRIAGEAPEGYAELNYARPIDDA